MQPFSQIVLYHHSHLQFNGELITIKTSRLYIPVIMKSVQFCKRKAHGVNEVFMIGQVSSEEHNQMTKFITFSGCVLFKSNLVLHNASSIVQRSAIWHLNLKRSDDLWKCLYCMVNGLLLKNVFFFKYSMFQCSLLSCQNTEIIIFAFWVWLFYSFSICTKEVIIRFVFSKKLVIHVCNVTFTSTYRKSYLDL